jgi:methyl-accepting chemotaxis protein
MTATDTSIDTRLNFIRMDGETRSMLRSMRPMIARVLPGILDEFYAHVTKYQDVARFFPNPAIMHHAKEMQSKHWDTVAEAAFDNGYVESVTRIGQAHNRLGLEPRWYIGGYALVITGLIQAIEDEVKTGWFGGADQARKQRSKMTAAIVTAALLDMDLAISVYLQSGVQAKQETLDRLSASFGGMMETLSATASELETAAATLSRTAESTQSASTSVSGAAEEASANVQSIASATEQLGASVNEISRQVQESSTIASRAVSQAEQTDAKISELSKAATHIGDVVRLITAIAEQTNLLALNATIEAARAGEAGKGFAVVAQEVKALAAQTAKATDDIRTQVDEMRTATDSSVAAIKEIGATIGQISSIASTIAAAVEQQGAATQEIAGSIQQAAEGTTHVANSIAEVSRGAVETSAATGNVLGSSKVLANESVKLRQEMDNFLKAVRVA